MSGIIDESNLKEIGKLSGADAILTGKVIKAFSQSKPLKIHMEIYYVEMSLYLLGLISSGGNRGRFVELYL